MDQPDVASLLADGKVTNHYQPILGLNTGLVVAIEVLARLIDGGRLIPPGRFLPGLGVEALRSLFFASLPHGLAALAACAGTHPGLVISFNVSPAMIIGKGFRDDLLDDLDRGRTDPSRLTLEILEHGEFVDLTGARRVLDRVHEYWLLVSLDDVGSGYSSLARLRDLPVQTVKLDQGFLRDVERQPENLQFVAAMQSLARGLCIDLVVEGVENATILDALGVMGIGAAQGYAIAPPMTEASLVAWLATHAPRPPSRRPTSLLGAFAAHLGVVEACRALAAQPLHARWSASIRDPSACPIGRFFDEHGLHDRQFGRAHRHFHTVIDRHADDPAAWEAAAGALRVTLQTAIRRAPRTRAPDPPPTKATGEPVGSLPT